MTWATPQNLDFVWRVSRPNYVLERNQGGQLAYVHPVPGTKTGTTVTVPVGAGMTRETPSSQYSNPNDPSSLHGSQSPHGVGTGSGGGGGGIKGGRSPVNFFFRAIAIPLLCLGCGPGSPTAAPVPEVYSISPGQLAAIHRHNPKDRTWHGQYVECRLAAKSYVCRPDRIEAHCVNVGKSGCVHFFTPFPPPDTAHEITAVGVCRGIVRDGIIREPGVDYFVHVDVVSLR